MDYTVIDPQLGEILFRKNVRARRYILRLRSAGVAVTIPRGGNLAHAERFFRENRETMIQKQGELKMPKFSHAQEEALRKQAKMYLPAEIQRLAQENGLRYTALTIRKSITRWGSCSCKGKINLSFYLMLLPSHLIEYVLLHELCHTVEMNHSTAFWTLLDKHTHGKSKALQRELRQYHIPR